MKDIVIDHQPSQEKLLKMKIFSWPIWTKEVSEFPWSYDSQETCYFLEGKVIVTPEEGKPLEINKGDLVIFPIGLSCTWKILSKVKKHYQFE